MKKLLGIMLMATAVRTFAVEIPLDSITPVRVGFVDLQRIFDSYPEKSFAEGDLLREIEKRKREMNHHQTDINILRQQISLDETALTDARKGFPVIVPVNSVPEPVVAAVAAPAASTSTVKTSSATVEAYPTEDPLAGLPGHDSAAADTPAGTAPALPGMKDNAAKHTMLDLLADATGAVTLTPEAVTALAKRVETNKQRIDRAIADFRMFRTNAIADMKVLQTQKTYGVMSKIYAVLQVLARDEGVMVVMDKAYVLYGEDAIDLSDKLIERLQRDSQG
jgi:Skp family chaperone for outer membrane proteins